MFLCAGLHVVLLRTAAANAALVVLAAIWARVVLGGVQVPLPGVGLAAARVHVADWARVIVRLPVARVAAAGVQQALTILARAGALLGPQRALAALGARALRGLLLAAAADALLTEAELPGATAVIAVAAVRGCGDAQALGDQFVAVLARDVLEGHRLGGRGRGVGGGLCGGGHCGKEERSGRALSDGVRRLLTYLIQ